MKKKTPERIITEEIRQLLNLCEIFHWKIWQGPMSSPKGISDIIGIYKGRFLAIEVKRDNQIPTPLQQAFLDEVKANGGIAILARSAKDVIEALGLEGKFR